MQNVGSHIMKMQSKGDKFKLDLSFNNVKPKDGYFVLD